MKWGAKALSNERVGLPRKLFVCLNRCGSFNGTSIRCSIDVCFFIFRVSVQVVPIASPAGYAFRWAYMLTLAARVEW